MKSAFALIALCATSCAAIHFVPRAPTAVQHRIKTDDGWELSLTQYPVPGQPSGLPVLLVSGISANERNMDMDERHSLARWLNARGREAWTLSLRATGESQGPDEAAGRPADFTFDAFWQHDVPSAIAFIRRSAHVPAVDYVGHSMGGMVAYAYLATGGQGMNAVVTLGSPTRGDFGSRLGNALLAFGPRLLRPTWPVPTSTLAILALPIEYASRDSILSRVIRVPDNTPDAVLQGLLQYGAADIAGGVAMQVSSILGSGKFTSADGAIDFKRALASVTRPVMVMAGQLDRLVIPAGPKDAYRALGGPKEWRLVSRANGAARDYGHMDLIMGDAAPVDVFAPLLDFLNRHAPRNP